MAIHLFNPLWDASGGSEWRTVSLFNELAEHTEVEVWSEYRPDARLLGKVPVREMLRARTYPTTGTFVFIGAYWEIGTWMKEARPERVILVYNVADPETLEGRIEQLKSYGVREVELIFPSEMFAQFANGRQGTVEFSPIDFDLFSPSARPANPKPTLGRHSRDQAFKHHPDDPALYRNLAQSGWNIRILGGACLGAIETEDIELLPANSVPAPEFLRSLDVFFYRTDPSWVEAYGRVVAEAMGCALPCVVERGGGYQTLIRHGENGYVFDTEEEAKCILKTLRNDEGLRERIGSAARESILAVYEVERKRMLDFYLQPT